MKSTTAKRIQRLDDIATNRYGIPSVCLMENAGRLVAEEIIKYCDRTGKSSICVVCGVGNNAGDGFVIARYLKESDLKVSVLHVGSAGDLKKDALINYTIFKKLGNKVDSFKKLNATHAAVLKKADVIVDALFGVGLNREIGPPFKEVIEAINKAQGYVVSVDVPSGIDATTGIMYGIAVKAKKTVTFTLAKAGLLKGFGKKCAGTIKVVDIGIPKALIKRICG